MRLLECILQQCTWIQTLHQCMINPDCTGSTHNINTTTRCHHGCAPELVCDASTSEPGTVPPTSEYLSRAADRPPDTTKAVALALHPEKMAALKQSCWRRCACLTASGSTLPDIDMLALLNAQMRRHRSLGFDTFENQPRQPREGDGWYTGVWLPFSQGGSTRSKWRQALHVRMACS